MSRRKKKRPQQAAPTRVDEEAEARPPAYALGQLAPFRYSFDDGSKFSGGFGVTELLIADYWTLRQRSSQLFEQNLYARGLIRRLVTNEVNVGLHLEATPEEAILGKPEDSLADWCETTENRFSIWGDNPKLCDQAERSTFGALQAEIRTEALVAGDVLVSLRQDPRTGLPRVQLTSGGAVRTPLGVAAATTNEVCHGVELDSMGRHVAYWVTQKDGSSKRMPAWGEKSGRRLSWLVYGTDKRFDQVRGKPILSLVLQSLKEIDRYRDSTQRKALVLSMLAMFVAKTEAKPGTRPFTRGATGRGSEPQQGASPNADRVFSTSQQVPGWTIEELQQGEEPKAFKVDGTVDSFGLFEEAIIQAVAWANEIPPEILTLSFNSNYSASQAAINEFKMYLNKVRKRFGDEVCQPIYVEWLISELLNQKIKAQGLIEAWRDSSQYDIFAAWISSDWTGQIKPAVDLSKGVGGYVEAIAAGFCTRDRASRELFGTKYSKNVQKLKRENQQLVEANESIAQLTAMSKAPSSDGGGEAGKTEAEGQGEDGADDKVEATSYPRRRRLALIENKEAPHVAT
jgi:lambda family phage portal protein